MISVPAAWLCRWRGATLVNWLQDVFPEVATALGITLFSGRIGRLLGALRDRSLRQATANVVLGERMAAYVASRGVAGSSIQVIANWSDDETLLPVAHADNPLLNQWDLAGRFVVMYSGNMGRAHEFETVLGAAAQLQQIAPEVVFLFVGSGAQKATVACEATRRGLANIVFRPYQDRALLGASLSVGHLHLISQQPATEGLIVPSKFYGVLGVGRPTLFVGDPDGELARIIRQHQIGATVEIGQVEALAQAVLAYRAAPERRLAQGQRARALFCREYSKSHALRRWAELLETLSAAAAAPSLPRRPQP
jgi:glycosyltransferase involved in cell wall biosynthesis